MSDLDGDLLECCKCGQSVDEILSLQCDHNLCLSCAAKSVSKWNQFTIFPPLICSICSSKTSLDPSAVQVLLDMNPQSCCSLEEQEQRSEILALEQAQQLQQTSFNLPLTNIVCQQHMTENCVLYCITCESQCFCMECYLQGLHKNHEVRNIMKSFDIIRENGNELQVLLQSCNEHLLNEQCKIANKKQDLIDLVSQAKLQIARNFDELYKTLKLKEQEMLLAADELVADKLIEIEGVVAKIKFQTEKVNQYNNYLMSYLGENTLNISSCVEVCNFIVKEKKRILGLVEQVRAGKISPTIQGKFCLDNWSISQMITDMRGIKLQLISLPGIESINPTEREKYLFQQAVKDKPRVSHQMQFEEKENQNSISFIERSSQKKSYNSSSREQAKFNESKKSLLTPSYL